jgi:hypothetical protein
MCIPKNVPRYKTFLLYQQVVVSINFVIFVARSTWILPSIQQLRSMPSSIIFRRGKIQERGPPARVEEDYLQ